MDETSDRFVQAVIHKFMAKSSSFLVAQSVAIKFASRSRAGIEKYGTDLTREDLTPLDWLKHAQEEAMDLANYLEVVMEESHYHDLVLDWLRRAQVSALELINYLEILIQEQERSN